MKIRGTSQVKHKYLYPCKVPEKNHCYHSKKTTIPQLMYIVDQDHAHYKADKKSGHMKNNS